MSTWIQYLLQNKEKYTLNINKHTLSKEKKTIYPLLGYVVLIKLRYIKIVENSDWKENIEAHLDGKKGIKGTHYLHKWTNVENIHSVITYKNTYPDEFESIPHFIVYPVH